MLLQDGETTIQLPLAEVYTKVQGSAVCAATSIWQVVDANASCPKLNMFFLEVVSVSELCWARGAVRKAVTMPFQNRPPQQQGDHAM